ncbi:hypothetical protein JJE65_00190 [Alloprevotella tannerae]|nr:hypothetical protein [Alloprevotella tannerae]
MECRNEEIDCKRSKNIYSMKDYSYIIDEACTGEKTPKLVRQIIPILVGWAKRKETNHTYGDLSRLLGYQDGRCIGHQLGSVQLVFQQLQEEAGLEKIPTLNALVSNARTGIPSEGFSYVHPKYDEMDFTEKQIIVENANNEAFNYEKWDYVLALLGLKPYLSQADEDIIRSGAFGFGGEGKEHKLMKEFIAAHPEAIGKQISEEGILEHILLSGDRVDVFFPKANVAVEVKPKPKPKLASDADILRGLFQCVKYKAILDAEAEVKGEIPDSEIILVIGGKLSQSNRNVQECLDIEVIEEFEYKNLYRKT